MSRLFKYSTVNINFLNCLVNNELYYCTADNFNDPFDSNVPFVIDKISDEDALEDAKDNDVDLINIDLQFYKNELSKQAYDGFYSKYQDLRSKQGILCLTTANNNILMWSHYSGSHNGVCLEINPDADFSETEYPDFKEKLFSVNYPENNTGPLIDCLAFLNSNLQKDIVLQMFCTKSKDWKYESEIRSFIAKGNRCIKFPKDAFTAIYFGVNSSNKSIDLVRSIRPDLKLFQGRKSVNKFEIEFDPIT